MRPEPVRQEPVRLEPVRSNVANSQGTKPKLSSITESLMRSGKKPRVVQGAVVKPDLSYKKKEPQLIDLEEVFMENRYQFEES